MLKNISGQQWEVFAFYTESGTPAEDLQATITAAIKQDGSSPVATDDQNPVQAAGKDGYYYFDLTKAETNAHQIWLYPVSSVNGVTVIGVPGNYSPSVNASPMLPYDTESSVVQLTVGGDYKTGTPCGPLLIPITSTNVSTGDVVRFGARLKNPAESIYVTGEVVSSDGALFGSFEIEGDTDLIKTASNLWRWGMEHVNGSGDVCPVASDMPMLLLNDRVVL